MTTMNPLPRRRQPTPSSTTSKKPLRPRAEYRTGRSHPRKHTIRHTLGLEPCLCATSTRQARCVLCGMLGRYFDREYRAAGRDICNQWCERRLTTLLADLAARGCP